MFHFVNVGTIDFVNKYGVIETQTIWIMLCLRSAAESWATMKEMYYPTYDGPDPEFLANYA